MNLVEQVAALIEGKTVSVDVSTGDHDAGNRLFCTVAEVMEDGDGFVILAVDPEPNFKEGPLDAQPAHLAIPGALEWDGDNGTHGADGESAYDDAKEACAEIERAGAPGDVIREMNDELVGLRAQLDESNVVRQLIQAWASVHGRPVPWATAIEITAVATKMPEDEKAALLALDDEPAAQYTAVDMTTAAADGFRDGLAAFSEDGKRNVLAEVFFQKGDDPFICAVRGRICVEQLEAAQRDFRENLPDELEQGDGIYTFDFFYEKGQYDDFGRCEIAPGWGFDFVSYAAFEAADEPVIERAVETGVMNAPKPYVAMTEAEADEFLSSFGGGSGNKAKRRIAEIEKAKLESFPCWSCHAPVTMANRADADGNCPHCEAELDLEGWPKAKGGKGGNQ
jgi:ribosomal protein L37AE/L43A